MLSRFFTAVAAAGVRPDTLFQRDSEGRKAYIVTVNGAEFRALPPVREGGAWLIAETTVNDNLDIETVAVRDPETLDEVLDLATDFALRYKD